MMRGTMIRLLLVVPLLAAGIALGAPKAASAATVCGDTASGNEVLTGTIKDSVVVADGSLCFLDGATVRGGVTIGAGGHLEGHDTKIRGSVSGTGVFQMAFFGGVVRGSVSMTVAGFASSVEITGAEVRGDVTLAGASTAALYQSIVRGSVTVNDTGFALVFSNKIGVNLTCAGNGPTSVYETNEVGGRNNCPAV